MVPTLHYTAVAMWRCLATLTYTGGDATTASEVTGKIPANTPVRINAKAGDYTFNATETQTTKAASPVSGALTGVWAEVTVPEGAYVLQNQNGTIAFYKVSGSDVKCPANSAYLTASASAKALSINFGGSTTGISHIAESKTDGEVYNLQGVEGVVTGFGIDAHRSVGGYFPRHF